MTMSGQDEVNKREGGIVARAASLVILKQMDIQQIP